MRYLLIILSFLSFLFSNLTIDDLSEEEKQIYNRKKIRIELYSQTVGSSYSNTIIATTTQDWSVYQGFNKISEYDFLDIAGYHEEAKLSKEFLSKHKRNYKIGSALTLSGIGILSYSSVLNDHEKFIYDRTSIGRLGGLTFLIGLPITLMEAFKKHNKYKYEMVKDIADIYNKNLIQEIKNSQ